MRIHRVKAQNFRNFAFLDMPLQGLAHYIVGENGQGKTNLLEAVNLITALRSFRTSDNRTLLKWDSNPKEAVLLFELEHPRQGELTVEIRFKPGSKKILIGGNPVSRMREFLGEFPTVAMSSHDIQLLRGSPQLRRRFVDLSLASVVPDYYEALRQYFQVIKERNALLKRQAPRSELRAFEGILSTLAVDLSHRRREFFQEFYPYFVKAYQTISPVPESPQLEYRPHFEGTSPEGYLEALEARLLRDQRQGSTGLGPHRDDFYFGLLDHGARDYASEGQQRGLVLALRLAQVAWFRERCETEPVVLADDILGELDDHRRRGFWNAIGQEQQVIASGTRLPVEDEAHRWQFWRMSQGEVSRDGERVAE